MSTPTRRRKVAANSRSLKRASKACSPPAAMDRLLQAVSTIRLPEPNGTILDANVDTRSPFSTPDAASPVPLAQRRRSFAVFGM